MAGFPAVRARVAGKSGVITGHAYETDKFTAPGFSILEYGQMLQSAAQSASTKSSSLNRPNRNMMRGSPSAARMISASID